MMMVAIWIGGVLAVVALLLVALHNHLVRLRTRADEAWAQVDTQLQRRHDLVPRMVATVGAYAGHEREAMTAVTSARVAALRVAEPRQRAVAEDVFGDALQRLLVVAEAYPDLDADAGFRDLKEELTATEDRIAFARGFANDRVARYRSAITTFPGAVLAGPFGFGDRPMFDADAGAARVPAADTGSR